MKAIELIEDLKQGAAHREVTCDTVKAGDAERELHRVAVSMFATVEVIRAAHKWGADMLVVHEPTYYNHMDVLKDNPVTRIKHELIERSGMVIYRYHDHMHFRDVDQITEAELHYLGLVGKLEKTPYAASYLFTSDTEVTALELAKRAEKELGIAHVRIAGARELKATKIAACFGTPGGVFDLLCSDDVQIVITGEACEWNLAEYARDAALLGMNKSLIVMGHIGSERDGMKLLTERIQEKHPDLEVRYIECGEVYSYT